MGGLTKFRLCPDFQQEKTITAITDLFQLNVLPATIGINAVSGIKLITPTAFNNYCTGFLLIY